MPMNVADEELGYAAGLFDGEGYVGTSRTAGSNRNCIAITANVYQNERRPLDWLVERFGGTIREGRPGQFQWTVSTHGAEAFFVAIRPMLLVKGEAVDAALHMWRTRPNARGVRGAGPRKEREE